METENVNKILSDIIWAELKEEGITKKNQKKNLHITRKW